MMTAATHFEPNHWRYHRGRGPVAHAWELIYRLRAVLASLPEHRLGRLADLRDVLEKFEAERRINGDRPSHPPRDV